MCDCFRAKTARVITFEQFAQAMAELAPKRFKGKGQEEALQQLYGLIVGKEPANVGVTVSWSLQSALVYWWRDSRDLSLSLSRALSFTLSLALSLYVESGEGGRGGPPDGQQQVHRLS